MTNNEHNIKIREEISLKEKKLDIIHNEICSLRKELKPPCKECPYDGEFRCETCKDNDYEGFNIKNYPRMYLTNES